jgi:hypothetical protein
MAALSAARSCETTRSRTKSQQVTNMARPLLTRATEGDLEAYPSRTATILSTVNFSAQQAI